MGIRRRDSRNILQGIRETRWGNHTKPALAPLIHTVCIFKEAVRKPETLSGIQNKEEKLQKFTPEDKKSIFFDPTRKALQVLFKFVADISPELEGRRGWKVEQ